MKILVVQTPEYDFCAATLIEGLHSLFEDSVVEFSCVEASNYAKQGHFDYVSVDPLADAEAADLIVVTSNQNVQEHLVGQKYRDKTVYIDGEDTAPYHRDPSDYPLYFKREMLLDNFHSGNVRPFPFGIEWRYRHAPTRWEDRSLFLSCMFGPHDATKPWRQMIEQRLTDFFSVEGSEHGTAATLIGSTYGGGITRSDVDTGNRDHSNYYEVLCKSCVSVDGYGAHGCNAARFWEILACGSCLFTQTIRIHMPDPFLDGEHYMSFNMENMDMVLDEMVEDEQTVKKISEMGYLHALQYHTTEARARYLLETCKEAGIIQ